MRILAMAAIALACASSMSTDALALPVIGQPAPSFTATDSNGKTVTLADFKGKTVVLEWTNNGCPYVRKHYGSGNMQRLQKEATGAGVVWLTVISSAPGKQGYVTGPEANQLVAEEKASPTAVLLDPKGDIGRAYEAQTTPHMFVVDGAGTLRYMGGIDDHPSAAPASLDGARNYVREALTALKTGGKIAETSTEPYGCSVKY